MQHDVLDSIFSFSQKLQHSVFAKLKSRIKGASYLGMGMVANSLIVETLPTATCKRGARIKRNSEGSSLLLNDYYALERLFRASVITRWQQGRWWLANIGRVSIFRTAGGTHTGIMASCYEQLQVHLVHLLRRPYCSTQFEEQPLTHRHHGTQSEQQLRHPHLLILPGCHIG